jgi:hypothetical protein
LDTEESDTTIELLSAAVRTIGTLGCAKKSIFLEELQVPCNPEAKIGRKTQKINPAVLRLKKTADDRSKAAEY